MSTTNGQSDALRALNALIARVEEAAGDYHYWDGDLGWETVETLQDYRRALTTPSAVSDAPAGDAVPFGLLLELMMCSDPWPLAGDSQASITAWADATARSLGFNNWIDAYHRLDRDSITPQTGGPA